MFFTLPLPFLSPSVLLSTCKNSDLLASFQSFRDPATSLEFMLSTQVLELETVREICRSRENLRTIVPLLMRIAALFARDRDEIILLLLSLISESLMGGKPTPIPIMYEPASEDFLTAPKLDELHAVMAGIQNSLDGWVFEAHLSELTIFVADLDSINCLGALRSILSSCLSMALLEQSVDFETIWSELLAMSEVGEGFGAGDVGFYSACWDLATTQENTVLSVQVSILSSILRKNADLVGEMDYLIGMLDGEFVEDLNLHLACLEGLGIIAIVDSGLRIRLTEFLKSFLLTPSFIFVLSSDTNCAILRECAAHVLSLVLDKACKEKNDSAFRKSSLFACINTMHTSYQQIKSKDGKSVTDEEVKKRFENSVSAISHLTRILKAKETIEIAIPALMRKLEESSGHKDVIWHALGNIGMTSDPEIFKSVLSFVLGGNEKGISYSLARMPGRPVGLMKMYLDRVLVLFHEKAAIIHKTLDQSRLSELKELCNLIRMILETEGVLESVKEGGKECIHELRNILAERLVIARHSLPLILQKDVRSLDVNLGSDSILIATFPELITSRMKNLLISIVPSKATECRGLSWSVTVYLITIYQMELLRMKNMEMSGLFGYLVDDRMQGILLYPVVEALADSILSQTVKDNLYKKLPNSVVEQHLKTLLVFAAHRLPTVRSFTAKWIVKILKVAPHMLFHRPSVFYMLDVSHFLDNEKVGLWEEHLSFYTQLKYISKEEVHESACDFFKLCQDWISSALAISSSATIPIMQSYVSDISSVSPWMQSTQRVTSPDDVSYSFLMALFQRFFADPETSANMIRHSVRRVRHFGEVRGSIQASLANFSTEREAIASLSKEYGKELRKLYRECESSHFINDFYLCVSRCAALVMLNEYVVETDLIMLICNAPTIQFSSVIVSIVMETLSWIMTSKTELVNRILAHLTQSWEAVAIKKLGIYSSEAAINPFEGPMTYGSPREIPGGTFTCEPHTIWIDFYVERFKFDRLQDEDCLSLYSTFTMMACQKNFAMSSSFKAYEARLGLSSLAVKVAKELSRRSHKASMFLWSDVFRICTDIFSCAPVFGEITIGHFRKIFAFYKTIKSLKFEKISSMLSTNLLKSAFMSFRDERVEFSDIQQLLVMLWEYEINRFAVWLKPLVAEESFRGFSLPPHVNEKQVKWSHIVKTAWRINPLVAVELRSRFINSADIIDGEIAELAKFSYIKASRSPSALIIFLQHSWKKRFNNQLRHLLYWNAVPPVIAIQIMSQPRNLQPWVIQYAIRSIEDFPITQVLFYIPQMVQALRFDHLERYVLEAAKSSQFFAHQIIWNMEANMYKDDGTADDLKAVFDRVIVKILQSLTGIDKDFYEREFAFFKEITEISGKLKPLVESGASKQEKKKKIDDELSKIKVDVGVYLPTNPDRTVIDIDYASGRPLQSHAKAPFMATFKVESHSSEPELMASIFKVGDDCRQDVLALQLISVFQAVFQSAGLDLYTFPYRVVATAPGCGVIEVIPGSLSRDMMGREKVNSLYDWFLAEFGQESSVRYKTARLEFVKSLAAYSIIMFLLQIKDRHNGNIMYDKLGHMIHIDFGFMLSIAPGGGILEVSPFKLTTEMINVMGGDANSPSYALFSELCVKGYLASRVYAEEIISIVQLMLQSGLPCFKGDVTIRKLRERFQLDKSERGAADFMIACIRQSHENTRVGLYDLFQFAQNGIPF